MRLQSLRSQDGYTTLRRVAYTGLILTIVSWVALAALAVQLERGLGQLTFSTSTTALEPISVSGPLIVPSLSLPDAPPILTDQPFGERLTGINEPLNSTQLAMINDEPQSYYDTAAKMWLNGSLSSLVGQNLAYSPLLTVNGKPTIIYLGAISCVYCAENRWAMALALSRLCRLPEIQRKSSAAMGTGAPLPGLRQGPAANARA